LKIRESHSKLILQHTPLFDKSDVTSVSKVIESGWVSEGSLTKQFEEEYAKFTGVKYAVTTTSGTAAISLSLLASWVKPKDEVLIPDITFVATANAVKMIGAKPVLVDVNSKNFTISIEEIKKKITKKTTAIIPVHLNGRPTYMDELMEIAKRSNLKIIEDASQALGSYIKKHLGSFGHAGAFSLAPSKIITTGQGGIITTNDSEIYENLRKLKDQGRSDKSDNFQIVGYNFKFTDIQAALGISQFKKLNKRLVKLKKIHKLYFEYLSKLSEITIPKNSPGTHLWYFDILSKNNQKLVEYLKKFKIHTRTFHKPLHIHHPYHTHSKFPISEKISSLGIFLPSASNLTNSDVERICKTIKSFY